MSEPAPGTDEPESRDGYDEFEYEHHVTRDEAIEHLELFIAAFREDERVTVTFGEETASFAPPEDLEFEFEYEEDGNQREIEIELEWTVADTESDSASGT